MRRDKPKQAKPSDLAPVNWVAIEPLFRAGIRSLRSIGKEYGVSHVAIGKHAREFAWTRNLRSQITARAEELVANRTARDAVTNAVTSKPSAVDRITVEANALAMSMVQLGHREDIAALRVLIKGLMRELAVVVEQPELFGMIHDALSNPDEPAIEALRSMATLAASLPSRTKTVKDLADALHRSVGMEREAFGLDTAGGTAGRPMVIIRDFTGRGDPDAPMRPKEAA